MIREGEFLSVKDVAEILDTEPYVLRFYEKELNLTINRNSKGHRVYTMKDVELFQKVQDMREQGLQLKAIETIVHGENQETAETYQQLTSIQMAPIHAVKPQTNTLDITDMDNDKVKQFSGMMKDVFKQALVEYNSQAKEEIKKEIEDEVHQTIDKRMGELEELHLEKNEEYYKKLDETMREVQRIRKEIAENANEGTKQKQSFWAKLFGEKDKVIEQEKPAQI